MRAFSLSAEASIGQVSSRQFGLITLEQALALGLSPDSVRRRVRAGALIRMAPGVFRVSATPRSWQQRAMAAALWVGVSGGVARGTAAALHRLDGFPPPVKIEVATTRPLRWSQNNLKVHRTPFLLPVDLGPVSGIRATSAERTLIDLAGAITEDRLEIAIEDALRRKLVTAQGVMRRLADLPSNQEGRARLTQLLQLRGAAPPTDSALEVKMIQLLRAEGYPPPIRQKILDDDGRFVGRVDLVFPERRLIIEVDSFRFHTGRRPWDRDRERRNALTALGWLVIHATSQMLGGEGRSGFLRDVGRAYNRPL